MISLFDGLLLIGFAFAVGLIYITIVWRMFKK